MILTAHQVNFFPYSGVLDKARRADIFVLLKHVQFTRNNYHNRFMLNDKWHTMSVNQKLEPLINKTYSNPNEDWGKILRRLPEYKHVLDPFGNLIQSSLADTNEAIIRRIFEILDIKTKIVSDFPTEKTGTERLVELCNFYGADVYLSGPSGKNYLDERLFRKVEYFMPTSTKAAIEVLHACR